MRYLKKTLFVIALAIIGCLLLPDDVYAHSVTVKTGGYGPNQKTIATIPAEKDVTTVGDIRKILEDDYDISSSEYAPVDGGMGIISDSEVFCGHELGCYGMENDLNGVLYIAPVDSTKKEFTVNSIPAKDENMLYSIYETNYELFGELNLKSCNEDLSKCTFADNQNYKLYNNVVIKYNYDKDIQEIAEKAIKAGLLNKTKFKLRDTELINYINYGGELADYCGEFKNQLSNLNFRFEMDARGGAADPFEDAAIGFYKFIYNDVLYGVKDFMEITAPHVIYVPTDTTDVKKAIEDRLNEILGDNNKIVVLESEQTINETLEEYGMDSIEGGNEHYYILKNNNEDNYFYEMEFYFMVKKDSSKIDNSVSFKSNDLMTNVKVSTDGSVPLDTLIKVLEIKSGKDYEKLLKVLKVDDSETFDISLYSAAQARNIEKLDNGKFLVSIPIPKKLEGKNLIVYYVTQDDEVLEYEVTVKDGYATFETDHFSIYTLAATSDAVTTNNPATGDNITTSLIILIISALGIIGLGIVLKNKKNYDK